MPISIQCVYIAILGLLSSTLASAQDGKLEKDHHGYATRSLEGRPYWATDLLNEIEAYAPPPPKANAGKDGAFWAANLLDDKASKYGPPPPRTEIYAPPPPRANANKDGLFWAIGSLKDKINTDQHGHASSPKTNAHEGGPFWATNSARRLKRPPRIAKTQTSQIDMTNSPLEKGNALTADESQTVQTRKTIEHKTDPFQASGLASGGFGRGRAQVMGPGYAFGQGSGGGWGTNGRGHGSGSAFAGMGGSFPSPGASA